MKDYFFLPHHIQELCDEIVDLGFAYIERLDPDEFGLFSQGLTVFGDCYGFRFSTENGVVMDACIKDAVFSFCLEPKAYDDPILKDFAANPEKLFLAAKARLKAVVKSQKARKPKQLSLIA